MSNESANNGEVGLHRVGEYARRQVDAARRDPRLDRDSGAAAADYLDYLDEADRVRLLAIGSIEDVGRSSPPAHEDVNARQAAWERAELARREVANGHPHLNAITLVGMFGNMDGFIEQLAASMQRLAVSSLDAVVDQAILSVPESSELSDEKLLQVRQAARSAMGIDMKDPRQPSGQAPARWEALVTKIWLGPDPARPLPPSLSNALAELTSLRHVLVHRAGRVDSKALKSCPRLASHLHYKEGQFVRLNRRDYRRYSAALRAYGLEVHRRLLDSSPRLSGGVRVDLDSWEHLHYVNA